MLYRVKIYIQENWGSPFIIGFMMLLLACAGLLMSSKSDLADAVAVCAYYALVIGIVLQIISFLRQNRKAVLSHASNGSEVDA